MPSSTVCQLAGSVLRIVAGIRTASMNATETNSSVLTTAYTVEGPATYIKPPSDGPTMVATWNVDELRATALPKISRGTRFGVIACDVGIANARAAPNRTSTTNTGHALLNPYIVKLSSSTAHATSTT